MRKQTILMSIKTAAVLLAAVLGLGAAAYYINTAAASHTAPGISHKACFNCHDGSVSGAPNILADFTKTDHHPYTSNDSTATCGPCHNSEGIKDSSGTVYPKLLQSFNASGTPAYTGNAFCGSCHGLGSTLINGDHLSTFVGTKHDTNTGGTGSGTGIKCVSCHNQHGSSIVPLIRETINGHNPSGDNNTICFSCHTTALGLFQGEAAFNLVPHASTTDTRVKWPYVQDAGAAVGGPAPGKCTNCHNPHGKSDGHGGVYGKYTLRNEEDLCFGGASGACHAAANSIQGINILAKFTAGADNKDHHNITDADQAATGSKVECTNCHNPHTNNAAFTNRDPDGFGNFTKETTDITLYPKAPLQARSSGKDSFTWGWFYPGGNYGDLEVMYVGKKWGEVARTMIEFDLSDIPTDAVVTSATLSLPEIAAGDHAPLTIEAHRNTQSWDEHTLNTLNAPAFSPTAAALSVSDNSNTWRNFNLTALVQGWINGSLPNYGLTLKAEDLVETAPSDNWREYWSSDHSYPPPQPRSARPRLTIKYTSATPPKAADRIAFCTKCHDGNPPAGVVFPPDVRSIAPNYTDPGLNGDLHGARLSAGPASASGYSYITDELEGPYYFGTGALRCTDCHDPHGSPNAYAIKETVNGNSGISIPAAVNASNFRQVQKFCSSCHVFTHADKYNCFSCHYHGANNDRRHGVAGKTYAYF